MFVDWIDTMCLLWHKKLAFSCRVSNTCTTSQIWNQPAVSRFQVFDVNSNCPFLSLFVFVEGNFTVNRPYFNTPSSLWGSPGGQSQYCDCFVWILWWFVLKAILVPLGAGCGVLCARCRLLPNGFPRMSLTAVRYLNKPFRRLHHRYLRLQKDWPRSYEIPGCRIFFF